MDIKILSAIMPIIYEHGYIAVIISAILEGASIPFPGSAVMLVVGFIIYVGKINIWVAIFLGGFFYSLASIIPYYIGKNLKGSLFHFLQKYFKVSRKRIAFTEKMFNEYGEVSICITRPFFMGNYISYLAGIANINMLRYFILTFIGIVPWMGLYLWLGYFFRGNLYRATNFIEKYNLAGVVIMIVVISAFIIWKFKFKNFMWRKKNY